MITAGGISERVVQWILLLRLSVSAGQPRLAVLAIHEAGPMALSELNCRPPAETR